jgi:uncharacterized repeat protein (TIGR01451 family)
LAPAAFITCTGAYTVTQADLDNGSVTNIATARTVSITPPATVTSAPATVTITADQRRSISLVKSTTSTGYRAVGVAIPYSYRVTNTGNVTITAAITVTDDKIAAVACPALPPAGLAPGAFVTCTATYTTVAQDLIDGLVTNTAIARSGALVSAPAVLTVTVNFRPEFTLSMSTPNPLARSLGDGLYVATFDILLENTGDVDLTEVMTTDDYQASLPPGATVVGASIQSITSSRVGSMPGAINGLFTATSASPNLFSGSGITLAISERVSIRLEITFAPGVNPPGPRFDNRAVATTIFNRGTLIARTATRTGTAPVRFEADQALQVTKLTPKDEVIRGALVPYTITVKNTVLFPRQFMTLVDIMPPGFKYRVGTATIDGLQREPVQNGRELTWPNVTIPGSGTLTLKLLLVVGAGVGHGEFTNEAFVREADGRVVSSIGRAKVRVIADPLFECSDIIGKVFDDRNHDGAQDPGEPGIANVRLATVRGQLITTDAEGRYHITCADIPTSDKGTGFILKLDERTLPTGFRPTTENPRVIRITKGKMSAINFGATLIRAARLELADAAFEPATQSLRPAWQAGLGEAIAAMLKERAVLKITYRRSALEDARLGAARARAVEQIVRDGWQRAGAPYRLIIETEVQFDRRAQR